MTSRDISGTTSTGQTVVLSAVVGESWDFVDTIADANGNPLDISSGYVLKMRVGFSTPLDLSTEADDPTTLGIELTGTTGQYQINVDKTTASAFVAGIYPFDLWYETSTQQKIIYSGKVNITQNTTPVPIS